MSEEHHEEHHEQQPNGVERHIQTVVVMVILGVLGWVGLKVADMSESNAKLEVQATNLASQIVEVRTELKEDINELKNEFRVSSADKYTATEADRTHNACRQRMKLIEERMFEAERGINDLRRSQPQPRKQ
jgi:predicted negative regulator of RcsB-dependent stress response